jgi:putative membrane protein
MIRNFLLRLVANAVALYVAALVIPAIHVSGNVGSLILAALIFGLVNALIGPILRFLGCPLVVLTLGIFTLVINAVLLYLTSLITSQIAGPEILDVPTFWDAIPGALVVSIVSGVLTMLLRDKQDDRRRS